MSGTAPGAAIVPPLDGISFTAYGVPIPQGSTKAFFRKGMKFPVVTADNAKTKPWRQDIVDATRAAMDGRAPLECPVEVYVTFYVPRPKTAPKRVTEPGKKPDLDKLLRALLDALTAAGVWRDDSQVTYAAARKAFAGGCRDLCGSAGVPRACVKVVPAETVAAAAAGLMFEAGA